MVDPLAVEKDPDDPISLAYGGPGETERGMRLGGVGGGVD